MVVWMARHHAYRSYRLSRGGALEVAEAAEAAAREAAARAASLLRQASSDADEAEAGPAGEGEGEGGAEGEGEADEEAEAGVTEAAVEAGAGGRDALMQGRVDFTCLGYEAGISPAEVVKRVLGEVAPEGGKVAISGLDSFVTWSLAHNGRTQLLRDLCLVGAAEFGVQPSQPLKEWEVVFELIKQYQSQHPPPQDTNFKVTLKVSMLNFLQF